MRIPYVEGYPRLLGPEVWRLFAREVGEVSICRFETNAGREVGWFEAIERDQRGLEARWKFYGPGLNRDVGLGIVGFAQGERKGGRPAPFRCPTCKQRVGNVVFVKFWRCAKCEGLRNRSTFLGRDVVAAERALNRRATLRKWVGAGRPKHMKQTTYRALRQELRDLEKLSATQHVIANVDRTEIVSGEWMTFETAKRIHHFDRGFIFQDTYTGP